MSFDNSYSWTDKLVHRLAFKSGGLQLAIADIEETMFKAELADVPEQDPVFVTALPRAGTTTLLDLLVKTGAFASHTYRDMPFVLSPLMWDKITGPLQRKDEAKERAHGDGVSVSADSAEPFEEMIWRQFWPDHYHDTYIEPWTRCDEPEFAAFYKMHMRKIVWLRAQQAEAAVTSDGSSGVRYVSKNNLNIARIGCLSTLFPEGIILIPFREPLQHALSLLAQHKNFLKMHAEDVFAREYMAGIGHFDFGANLKPVNFNDWVPTMRFGDATTLNFWLDYWVQCYRALLPLVSERVRLVSYGQLTAEPERSLGELAGILGMQPAQRLTGLSGMLRPPREHSLDGFEIEPDLRDAALAVFSQLERAALAS